MTVKLPAIFLNFKTYREATGKNAVKLARTAETVARKTGVSIVLAVQAADIHRVAEATSLPVFAQHLDPVAFGSHTGHTLAESLKEAGAVGTLLNHAENKRPGTFLEEAVAAARRAKLRVLLCAETTARARALARLAPDFIAIEPPELIGGNVSVSTAKPEIITRSVEAIRAINPRIVVLTGAGIKSGADARRSLELGARGVLVASGVVKARSPAKALAELASALTI